MKINKTIVSGQPGAKRWERKYGNSLLCVRYRYDEETGKKFTTVELIVEEKNWDKRKMKIPHNKKVPLRVLYGEKEIASLVKNAGGIWKREEKVWELAYKEVVSLGLEDRIVNWNKSR